MGRHGQQKRVLIIVQNLPVPFDRRVWLECQALVGAGYGVSVICPKGTDDPSYQELDGVRIYKFRPAVAAHAKVAFVYEFLHGFLATLWLVLKVARRDGFDAVQVCNPPDTLWPIGLMIKPFGKKFVFDQHDLCPELYQSRFPSGTRSLGRALLWLERRTYRAADHVVSTNESYREIALTRGGKRSRRGHGRAHRPRPGAR